MPISKTSTIRDIVTPTSQFNKNQFLSVSGHSHTFDQEPPLAHFPQLRFSYTRPDPPPPQLLIFTTAIHDMTPPLHKY